MLRTIAPPAAARRRTRCLRPGLAAWLLLAALLSVFASPAAAQTFPADSAFRAQLCGGVPITDPVSDAPGGNSERDIVGVTASPAVYYANDGTYLYLRMRVGGSPLRNDGTFVPFGWGFEFDTDGNLNTYEFIVILNGVGNAQEVVLAHNTVTAAIGSPSDVAEVVVQRYAAATHARATATTTTLAGMPDYFVTVAVPLNDLRAAGVPFGSLLVWSGTSASGRSLSLDIACHDGTSSVPLLGSIPVGPIVAGAAVSITAPAMGSTTNDSTPTITGTASPGTTVTVSIDGGAAVTVPTSASGAWTYTPSTPLSNAMHTIVATATDTGGHAARATVSFSVNASAPTLTITTPTNGSTTDDATPTITGTAAPGATVRVTVDAGVAVNVTANGTGIWTFTPALPLANGAHSVTAATTSTGGTATASVGFTVTSAAPTLTITMPTNGSTTNDTTPTVTGTAAPGATVRVTVDGGVAVTAVANTAGVWTFTPVAPLTNGSHTINASSTNAGGATATASVSFTVASATPLLTITTPTSGSTTNDTTPTVAGTAAPGAMIRVSVDGSAPVTVVADVTGVWSFTPSTPLTAGMHTVNATTTNGAGVSATASVSFTLSTTAPPLSIDTPVSGSTSSDATPTISGTTAPGASVRIVIDGGAPQTVTADGTGRWTFTPTTPLGVGAHTVTVTATTAGGSSTASRSFGTVPPTGCTSDANCGGDAPICDTATRTCRACAADTECTGAAGVCATSGACVACTATAVNACTANPTGMVCLADLRCGCASDSDCASNRRCDGAFNICVPREGTDGGSNDQDASADGATRDGGPPTITGDGACACRAAGQPTRQPGTLVWLLAGAAVMLSGRRRKEGGL